MDKEKEKEEMTLGKLEKEMGESCESRDYDDCFYTGKPCDLNCRYGLILGKFKRCLNYEKKQAVKEFAKKLEAIMSLSYSVTIWGSVKEKIDNLFWELYGEGNY